MMVLKLDSSNFEEPDYSLFAIHSNLEDYRIAFFLNEKLQLHLSKCEKELHILSKKGEANFSRFEYLQEEKDRNYNLIENKKDTTIINAESKNDLFAEANLPLTKRFYLVPEFKKVDFFLKIDNKLNEAEILKIIHKIKTINGITAVYAVLSENIKSKNNLIFY